MSGQTVWLASYPKSGSTWFRAVIAAWRRDDPFALARDDPMASVRNRFDEALGIWSTDLAPGEIRALRPAVDDIRNGDQVRVRKIHDSLYSGVGGTACVSLPATRCAIYVMRDPRDVAVSYAHHSDRDCAWGTEQLCAPDTLIGWRDDDISVQFAQHIGDWSSHVHGWVDAAPFPVHVMRYEDCLADPVTAFGDALAFAGFSITSAELRAAVDAAAFERLRERERADGFVERWGSAPFFRRGVAGAWRDELSPELVARIEQAHGPAMIRFGYALTEDDAEMVPSSADREVPA